MEGYFVYILAGRKKGELYVGMAKNLKRRLVSIKTFFATVLQKNIKLRSWSIMNNATVRN